MNGIPKFTNKIIFTYPPQLDYKFHTKLKFSTETFKSKFSTNASTVLVNTALESDEDYFIIHQIGTIGEPIWWTGLLSDSELNVVEFLPEKLMIKLREKTALVHYDQSWEGYPFVSSEVDLYKSFYENFKKFNLPASQFLLTTCNLYETQIHDRWCADKGITDKMNIVSANFFAEYCSHPTFFGRKEANIIHFEEHITYKTINEIKLFNCLNRTIREHRIWFTLMLNYFNLIDINKVSHNKFTKLPISKNSLKYHPAFDENNVKNLVAKLPLVLDCDQFHINHALNFFKQIYMDTWVSIITETFFFEKECVFFSEKIYKPMRACHPFILVGQIGGLRELKKLGFKTFDKWWDESYDDIDCYTSRMEAICKLLISLQSIDKYQWIIIYQNMREVLEHNYNHLISTNWIKPLENYVKIKFSI